MSFLSESVVTVWHHSWVESTKLPGQVQKKIFDLFTQGWSLQTVGLCVCTELQKFYNPICCNITALSTTVFLQQTRRKSSSWQAGGGCETWWTLVEKRADPLLPRDKASIQLNKITLCCCCCCCRCLWFFLALLLFELCGKVCEGKRKAGESQQVEGQVSFPFIIYWFRCSFKQHNNRGGSVRLVQASIRNQQIFGLMSGLAGKVCVCACLCVLESSQVRWWAAGKVDKMSFTLCGVESKLVKLVCSDRRHCLPPTCRADRKLSEQTPSVWALYLLHHASNDQCES